MSDPFADQLNATITRRYDISKGLAIFRIESDTKLPEWDAGQYCTLGLPSTYPRHPDAEPEEPRDKDKMIRRAYSIGSAHEEGDFLDLYIIMVEEGEFTPRLFQRSVGERIWLGPRMTGHFTLAGLRPASNVLLLSTGTGLAPYMAMIRETFAKPGCEHKVVVAHGCRYSWELGYKAELEVLAKKCDNITYVPSITRPQKDPSWQGITGYLQAQLEEGTLEEMAGLKVDASDTHVFLCGNPGMIDGIEAYLAPKGFSEWTKRKPDGNIHKESYW